MYPKGGTGLNKYSDILFLQKLNEHHNLYVWRQLEYGSKMVGMGH